MKEIPFRVRNKRDVLIKHGDELSYKIKLKSGVNKLCQFFIIIKDCVCIAVHIIWNKPFTFLVHWAFFGKRLEVRMIKAAFMLRKKKEINNLGMCNVHALQYNNYTFLLLLMYMHCAKRSGTTVVKIKKMYQSVIS